MDTEVAWFKALSDQLATQPAIATPQFIAFRDSETALDLSRRVLLGTDASSTIAQFYALNAAQYSIFMRWSMVSVGTISEWKALLEKLLLDNMWTTTPSFHTNKLIQFYVSLQKRAWNKLDTTEKQKVQSFLTECLRSSSPAPGSLGAAIALCILEEFSSLRFTDYNFPISEFNLTKENFEKHFLHGLCEVVTESLTNTLSSIMQSASALDFDAQLRKATALSKCINVMLSWSPGRFDPRDLDETEAIGKLSPPSDITRSLIAPGFQSSLFAFYSYIRLHRQVLPYDRFSPLLDELRSSFGCFGQLHGDVINTNVLDSLLVHLGQWCAPVIIRRTYLGQGSMELLTFESDDFGIDHNLRALDLQSLSSIAQTIFVIHGVENLVKCPHFPEFLNLLQQVTSEVTGEVASLVADVLLLTDRAAFTGTHNDEADKGLQLLESWRFELFISLVDLWTSSFGDDKLDAMALVGNDALVSLTTFLNQISANMFPAVFDQVIYTCVCACAVDEEEGEDLAEISEQHLIPALQSVAAFARFNLPVCLPFLAGSVQSSRSLLASLVYAGHAVPERLEAALERLRLTVLVLTFIYVDDFSPSTAVTSLSTEVIINERMLDALLIPPCQQSFIETIQNLLTVLQDQLQTEPQLCSPILVSSLLTFLALLLHRYIDPCLENYRSETLQKYAFLSGTLQGQLWDPVTEALLRCALIAIRLFPFESDVVLAACTCLDGLSRFTAVHRVSQLRHCAESLEESILGSLQRLSGPSLAQVSQKIVELSVAIHHHGIVHKVLHVASEDVAFFRDPDALSSHHRSSRGRALALLTALARCSASELDTATFAIMQSFCDILMTHVGRRICLEVLLGADSSLLSPLLACVYACMDGLIIRMPSHLTHSMCALLLQLFRYISANTLPEDCQRARAAPGDTNAAQTVTETLSILLDILQGLSTKEFVMRDDAVAIPNLAMTGASPADNMLPDLLLHCLSLILAFVEASLLRCNPSLADKFISLVLYLASSHDNLFVVWLGSLPVASWRLFLQNLLSLSSQAAAATARQALQVLHIIGAQQITAMRSGKSFFGTDKDCDLLFILRSLLRFVLAPRKICENIFHPAQGALSATVAVGPAVLVSSDRQDAFANAVVVFIVLCGAPALQSLTQGILEGDLQLPAAAHLPYWQLLNSLVTDRQVVLDGRDPAALLKKNRQLFVLNFRDFLLHVKALNAAHANA